MNDEERDEQNIVPPYLSESYRVIRSRLTLIQAHAAAAHEQSHDLDEVLRQVALIHSEVTQIQYAINMIQVAGRKGRA
jgi:hypothetical protein